MSTASHELARMAAKRGGNRGGNRTPARVPEVETLPCPAVGLHVLTNVERDDWVVTLCQGCKATWGELDRIARTPVPRPTHCACGRRLVTEHTWKTTPVEKRPEIGVRCGEQCKPCWQREHKAAKKEVS